MLMLFGFWIPVILSVAFLLVGWGLTKVDSGLPPWAPYAAFGAAAALLLIAFVLGALPWSHNRYDFSPKKASALSDFLKNQHWEPETVTIRYVDGCDDCRAYAQDLADTLRRVGWRGQIDTTLDRNPELRGLHLVVESINTKPASGEMLAAAFRQAGVAFQWSTWQPPRITPLILFVYPKA